MTIDRNQYHSDNLDVSCDTCSFSESYDGTFMEVVEYMRNDGWRITFDNNDYIHHCPACVEKDNELEDFI